MLIIGKIFTSQIRDGGELGGIVRMLLYCKEINSILAMIFITMACIEKHCLGTLPGAFNFPVCASKGTNTKAFFF